MTSLHNVIFITICIYIFHARQRNLRENYAWQPLANVVQCDNCQQVLLIRFPNWFLNLPCKLSPEFYTFPYFFFLPEDSNTLITDFPIACLAFLLSSFLVPAMVSFLKIPLYKLLKIPANSSCYIYNYIIINYILIAIIY